MDWKDLALRIAQFRKYEEQFLKDFDRRYKTFYVHNKLVVSVVDKRLEPLHLEHEYVRGDPKKLEGLRGDQRILLENPVPDEIRRRMRGNFAQILGNIHREFDGITRMVDSDKMEVGEGEILDLLKGENSVLNSAILESVRHAALGDIPAAEGRFQEVIRGFQVIKADGRNSQEAMTYIADLLNRWHVMLANIKKEVKEEENTLNSLQRIILSDGVKYMDVAPLLIRLRRVAQNINFEMSREQKEFIIPIRTILQKEFDYNERIEKWVERIGSQEKRRFATMLPWVRKSAEGQFVYEMKQDLRKFGASEDVIDYCNKVNQHLAKSGLPSSLIARIRMHTDAYIRMSTRKAKQQRDMLNYESYRKNIDPLTLALRRDTLLTIMPKILGQRKREAKGYIGLIMFDIDHFKQFNDRYGHHVGDEVLHFVGTITKGMVRKSDFFSRHGGEEFLIFMPDTKNPTSPLALAEKIRKRIEEGSREKIVMQVTISCGVGVFKPTNKVVSEMSLMSLRDSMIKMVDEKLYVSKNSGRNRSTSLGSVVPI